MAKEEGVLFPMLAGVGDTSARAAFVIDTNGVVQYSEQTATPKDLPNFDAIKEILPIPVLGIAEAAFHAASFLATGFSAEGEATAHVLAQALRSMPGADGAPLVVTRLARGVPVGSELEYVDLGTIAHALVDRRST